MGLLSTRSTVDRMDRVYLVPSNDRISAPFRGSFWSCKPRGLEVRLPTPLVSSHCGENAGPERYVSRARNAVFNSLTRFPSESNVKCLLLFVTTLRIRSTKILICYYVSISAYLGIQDSVVQISPSTWCLGCTVQCDRVAEPDDTCTAAWRDGENWYTLRPVSDQPASSEKSLDATPADSHEVSLIHTGGTLSAAWAIGNNAICKVHHWSSDTTSESETIKSVQKMAPQVPIPEVITSWVDGERSFLVLKRVPGITLRDAWGTMSASQQDSILNEVVHFCEILASITSERL
jgi:hypothetical protein